MTTLWENNDPAAWENIQNRYWDIVESLNKEKLLPLEKWQRNDLPGIIKKNKKLTQPELVQLVEWKVGQRGKFRPRLLNYAKEASPEDVETASSQAFSIIAQYKDDEDVPEDALKQAMSALTALRGIGPATASAALSAAHPFSIPFQSDEAMLAVLGSKEYTVKSFLDLTVALRKKARELSENDGKKVWTARDVEACLFAATKDATTRSTKTKDDATGASSSRGGSKRKR